MTLTQKCTRAVFFHGEVTPSNVNDHNKKQRACVGSRESRGIDKFCENCVYILVASHLHKPNIRNTCTNFSQPVNDDTELSRERQRGEQLKSRGRAFRARVTQGSLKSELCCCGVGKGWSCLWPGSKNVSVLCMFSSGYPHTQHKEESYNISWVSFTSC